MEYFNLLPSEITMDIISRLPTEAVFECKLVSTNWRSLVGDPSFSKMHLDHLNHPVADSCKLGFIALTYLVGRSNFNLQYFEYNGNYDESIERITRFSVNLAFTLDTAFIGSCNGLICLYQRRYSLPENTYTICNPITREYVLLPEISRVGMVYSASGFGYVTSTNEYKVVKIMYEITTKFTEIYVYKLGSGHGWRNLGKLNFRTREYYGEGMFVDGALHWLDDQLKKIVTFDLAEEKFCEHLSPPLPLDYDSRDYYELGVLDGCLCFAINRDNNGAECWDVWLLKKKNDNHGRKEPDGHQSLGWSKVFTVYDREFFAVTKSYAVLTYNGNLIDIHDLEASTSKTIMDFKELFTGVFPHKNTLVSLKELGEEDTKIMESVETEETGSHDQPFNPTVGG